MRFVDRHNGPDERQVGEMLAVLGLKDLSELVAQTVPSDILLKEPLALDKALSEHEYLGKLKNTARKNIPFRSMIGCGFYGTATPSVIKRNILENPSWYTSYTPYQAEISQGRLEALLNFQTMIASLTGFNLANCSMLDDSTAAAEAMRMMYELRPRAAVKEGRNIVFVDENIFPQNLSVIMTRAKGLGIEVVTGSYKDYTFDPKCYGAIVQFPAADGSVRDYGDFARRAHEAGAMVTAICDLLSLAIFKEPAAWGADIAVGSAQRFGLPMGFGGPVAGWMATKDEYKRFIPGRIIGISVDRLGKPAYRLALQTREQHIKREKATSNICTATALMAVMSGMYAAYHGADGIREIAFGCYKSAHKVAEKLSADGYTVRGVDGTCGTEEFFDTIEIMDFKGKALDTADIRKKAEEAKINFYYTPAGTVRISFDELTDCKEKRTILDIFGAACECGTDSGHGKGECCKTKTRILARENEALTQEIFNKYHSETEMMRYIKKLERKDISLTHSMIPLGSCTMKLNAATEMAAVTWSEFADVHPFAPAWQTEGSMQIVREVEHDLSVITGMAGCSLQATSGAGGEYAGLTTIRAYLRGTGQENRDVMIIPTSAHGTNPASAAMAGFRIVLVGCDENGNINVEELCEKARENKDCLAGIMITYPSTHGVFEVHIRKIVDTIHENGGLVYMDGANMNAQVGITNPGFIGADVCHLNLHKTFAMPHGGGGPGVGPICVTEKLLPYLPGYPLKEIGTDCGLSESLRGTCQTAVGASPYGSPLLLPITHAYIKMLGPDGLRRASEIAILNANYVSVRLAPEFRTYYTGETGRVAHECIIDLQNFKADYGVDATDVAKRLMDYGFHAPTLSFPVHETLMVEPTESESKDELDRFIEAMKSIKDECEAITDQEDNLLKMAPHTAEETCADTWNHPYGREQAAYPLEWIRENKFWPACARVDNGYGDRNLVAVREK